MLTDDEKLCERRRKLEPMSEKLLSSHGDALQTYARVLASYSGKIRLTGPADPEVIWKDHILDCLSSVPLLPEKGRVVDVGSGGGLPGLVWAVCRPDLEVTLLDSVRKKCGALESMASELRLSNVRVVWSRCEDYALKDRENFLLAGARAVAATGILLEYLSPFVRVGGRVFAMKGPLYTEELLPLHGKWNRLGLAAPSIISYDREEKQRFLLLWTKNSPCPKRFPRKVGTAENTFWWR